MILEHKRKVVLPVATITQTCEEGDPGAIKRAIPATTGREATTYFYRPLMVNDMWTTSKHGDFSYNLLPIVLDQNAAPWDIANVYILSRLEASPSPNMNTYQGVADDLSAFKKFLDDKGIDFTSFPQMKLKRPTYRYHGYLKTLMFAREIAPGTAKRRMGCVIAFYRWLMREGVVQVGHDPWAERDYFLTFKNAQGFEISKTVKTTDITVKAPKNDDPFEGKIGDGGKLRPLSSEEQAWLKEALVSLGNTEMFLIHAFALLTGARIQTVCTLRVRHFSADRPANAKEYTLTAGPKSGVDTKFDKTHVLHMSVVS